MNIQLFSDLHLEFADFQPKTEGADVVILAGDIHLGSKAINWVREKQIKCPIIYVLGNHEYYKHAHPRLVHKLEHQTRGTNVHILENQKKIIDDVVFHGATLWTDFNLFGDARTAGMVCQDRMNDFTMIRRSPFFSKLRPMDAQAMHRKSLAWLEKSLKEHKGQTNVVVTHHAPSMQSVPQYYRGNLVSAGYASHLEPFIREHQPNLWCHGHLHINSDYQVGSCRVVCNPRGYMDENPNFDPQKIIGL